MVCIWTQVSNWIRGKMFPCVGEDLFFGLHLICSPETNRGRGSSPPMLKIGQNGGKKANYPTPMQLLYLCILNNVCIIPENKLLSRTELDTKKRQTVIGHLVKKVALVKKKTTKPNALLQKKANNPLFEDESFNKITFNCRDFYFATIYRNLKTAFDKVRVIISK